MNAATKIEPISAPHVLVAINAVMSDLSREGIAKDRSNEQQRYKFRGIDDVYNALAPTLAKHKLIVKPRGLGRACEERQSKNGGTLFFVNVSMEFDLISAVDGSRETAGPFYGEAMDSADKATNKAQSAAFKYFAMQQFCIPTEGDNDADATTHEVVARPEPKRAEQIYAEDQGRPRTDDRGVRRLSSAEAKRIGLHTEIEGKLDRCESLLALDLFESAFDTITAQCPLSWLDALRNRIILRREELTSTTGKEDADMDEAYRATMAG